MANRFIHKFAAAAALSVAAVPGAAQTAAQKGSAPSSSATAVNASADGLLFAVIGGPGKSSPTPFNTIRRPTVIELEVSKTLRRSSGKRVYYEYFVASQPLVGLGGNLRFTWTRICGDRICKQYTDVVSQHDYSAYGFGITPLGLRASFPMARQSRLSISFGAGGVYVNKAVPADAGTHLNFQFSLRPALTVPVGEIGKLWAGYELFHMSNGNTGKINPGINAGLLMVGFQRARW